MEKAKQTNFLANPNSALDLLSSMGENIHTTFKISEINTLIDTAQTLSDGGDIDSRIKHIPLWNTDDPTYSVVDGSGNPILGEYNYTGIHRLITKIFSGQLDLWATEDDEEIEEYDE
jgi:hypothetical protein